LGIFRLRRTQPEWPRPYKAFGYPVLPLLYVLLAGSICVLLFIFKPKFTWPGLGIVLLGIPIYYGIKNGIAKNKERNVDFVD
jgi:APA family basic amino acid/polyamine antiporter